MKDDGSVKTVKQMVEKQTRNIRVRLAYERAARDGPWPLC